MHIKVEAWNCNYSVKTRALTPLTSVCSDNCVPSCMCVSVWCNLSHRFAQFLHSWPSQYSRLRYVTASSSALPLSRGARSSTLTSTTNACTPTQTDSSDVSEFASVFSSLHLPPYLGLSIVHTNVFILSPVSYALHIYPISPHLYLFHQILCARPCVPVCISLYLSRPACLKFRQNIANHWPDVKPFC